MNELNPIEELQWRLREQEKTIKSLEEALRDLLNDCINFDGGKLTDSVMERASGVLKGEE